MAVRQWVGCMGGSVLTVSSEKHDLQLETNWSATIDALVGVRSIVMLPARVEFRLDLAVTSNRTEPVGLYYMVISCKKQDRISTEAYFEKYKNRKHFHFMRLQLVSHTESLITSTAIKIN